MSRVHVVLESRIAREANIDGICTLQEVKGKWKRENGMACTDTKVNNNAKKHGCSVSRDEQKAAEYLLRNRQF